MNAATRMRFAKVVLPGLAAGGGCGAAVALGWVPPALGVGSAIVVAIAVGWAVHRIRKSQHDVDPSRP